MSLAGVAVIAAFLVFMSAIAAGVSDGFPNRVVKVSAFIISFMAFLGAVGIISWTIVEALHGNIDTEKGIIIYVEPTKEPE